MILVNPPHGHFSQEHLNHVIGEMRKRGAPRLRAYFDGEIWHAREGTHRLRAAKALGLTPILIPAPWQRTGAALTRARYAAMRNAHVFEGAGAT